MKNFWNMVHASLADNRKVFIALVVEHSIHSPGTTGARLAVCEDGESIGTIGGGIMEFEVVRRGKDALLADSFTPTLQTLVHRQEADGTTSGLICAGQQTNLYYLCHPSVDGPAVALAAEAQSNNAPGQLTITNTGMQFDEGPVHPHTHQYRLERTPSGWSFVEELLNLQRVAILGGGHCGYALSRVLRQLGYDVTVFDTRPDIPTMQSNVFADRLIVFGDLAEAGPTIPLPEITQIVVMTTDLSSDVRSLLGVLPLPFPFIGLMGSSSKIASIKMALRSAGVMEAQLEKLTAPVGLTTNSRTPEEIAVSIAAQLVHLPS